MGELSDLNKQIQTIVGAHRDGIWGKNSARATLQHLGEEEVPDNMNWPDDDSSSQLIAFYGEPGSNQTRCNLPFDLRLSWDLDRKIRSFACHKKVSSRMEEIFRRSHEKYGDSRFRELRLDRWGGCLNVRYKRGSRSQWSVHAFGAAVDVDPNRNRLRWGKDKAHLAKPEYDDWWEIVEECDGVSLGRKQNFDWMHVQWAKV